MLALYILMAVWFFIWCWQDRWRSEQTKKTVALLERIADALEDGRK